MHNEFMGMCLQEARQGMGSTSPNPMVGAVIVKDNQIIGQGYHKKAGEAHAEIEALKNCAKDTNGATLYVNFEPCCHHGKTPPCTDAIIGAGISSVVVGMMDPNPLVAGKGIASLRNAGIEVLEGVREKQCAHLNRFFSHWITKRKPYIVAKAAVSVDWKIAKKKGVRTQITGLESKKKAHELRSMCDAILVGVDTVIIDDPFLTYRHSEQSEESREYKQERQPLRIILDSRLRIPLDAHVLKDSNVIIVTTDDAEIKKRARLEEQGVSCITLPRTLHGVNLSALLDYCSRREIMSILVEGGANVFDSFIEADSINEWHIFQNDQFFGNEGVQLCSDVSIIRDLISKQTGVPVGSDTYYCVTFAGS